MVDLPHRQPVLGYARNLDSSGSLWVAETIRAGSGDHPAHELMKVWIDLDLCSRDGSSARRTRRARLRGGAVRRRASGRGTLSDGAYESFRVRPRCPDWEVDDADSLSGEDAPKEETNVVSRSRIKSVTGGPGRPGGAPRYRSREGCRRLSLRWGAPYLGQARGAQRGQGKEQLPLRVPLRSILPGHRPSPGHGQGRREGGVQGRDPRGPNSLAQGEGGGIDQGAGYSLLSVSAEERLSCALVPGG